MKSRLNSNLKTYKTVQRCNFPDCKAACCVHGTWIDTSAIATIRNQASLISPYLLAQYQDPETWFDDRKEPDPHALSGFVGHTRVIPDSNHYGGTACVFLREDYKCALQVAAQMNGMHSWYFKPFYCILHPLELDTKGRITINDISEMATEPASCLRSANENMSLIALFEPELSYFLGKTTNEKQE